ncbi:APC family permease [Haliscomenobacter hydrossis]|uniref:Amino acid permease-associated region n=1 Tax=Haliscomenobacter hydrossis (strain ATCC 27775 / DSM 1100 / LMG 10767 / O) TaxID=760192 RepID=F4L4I7_HALH1|nr:amino acid permease-associated region [Haliscomenobacter hydrossis DSM 1100]
MNVSIDTMRKPQKIGWGSAAAVVVANMVGTGVFTSLGFQVDIVQNRYAILLLWALGGLNALLGAFAYAELGTHLRRSGGEYHYLSTLYHPFLGYLSGWISVTVGFGASVALTAMAMGFYMTPFLHQNPTFIAFISIVVLSLVHSFSIRQSSLVQNGLTILKVALIVLLIVAGWYLPPAAGESWQTGSNSPWIWDSAAFAVALVFVNYSYSGWNAAAYIVEEIRQPIRNLPRALIGGAAVVSVLYVLLQLSFLRQVPLEVLMKKVEVGHLAAESMFGATIGNWFSVIIALLLASSLSAMVWVGPRIIGSIAKDHENWRFFRTQNRHGIPVRAIWFQACISLVLILTGTFEQLLLYSGFILQLFNALTIAGVFILRYKFPELRGYRSPWFPWLQLIYLIISVWMLVFLLIDKPIESLLGLANLALGALTFFWGKKLSDFYPKSEIEVKNQQIRP